jgi:hypothetical protein
VANDGGASLKKDSSDDGDDVDHDVIENREGTLNISHCLRCKCAGICALIASYQIGQPDLDLFAMCQTSMAPCFVSREADTQVWATNAFLLD